MSRIAITLLLFLAACAPKGDVDQKGAASTTTLRCPLERVASMDPIHAASVYDSCAVSLVYEPLLEIDYEARPYRLKPGSCSLIEISTNRLAYTFRLRDGVRFQDDPCFPDGKGRDATAEDIVYSLERLRDPKNASSGMWTMASVEDVVAVDARTVTITLKKPCHFFEWLMAMAYAAIVPHEAVEEYGNTFGQHAVGTGPYRLEKWERNHRMVFTRDAKWRGWAEIGNPAPYDKIEYLVVTDPSTQWLMFLNKEVDYIRSVDRNNWTAAVEQESDLAERGVCLLTAPALQVMYIGVNMDDPLLGKNKKLRQALNCAFDTDAWSEHFLKDRGTVADGPLPPGMPGKVETPFAYAFNVEKAKTLLAEAGFENGIDPKTGKRLVIPLAVGRADSDAREQVELLQGFYDRVGIRLEPQYMTWAAYLSAVSSGHVTLFLIGWVDDYPDAENFMQLFYSKNCSPGPNHCNYRNPEFDKCYDEAISAETPDARLAAWARAQEIVREDCPWIFLHYPKACSVAWNHVGNYRLTDFPYGREKYLRAR